MKKQRRFADRSVAGHHLMRIAMAAALFLVQGSTVMTAHAGEDGDDPVVDQSKTSLALKNLPRKSLAERVAVTIYDFRSSSNYVTPLAATDIFTTALIDSGQFRVVERAQVQQSVIREKQLNAAGMTTGTTAQKQLRGAQYIFEGTVSEANTGENQKQGGVNIGGLNFGGAANKDTIAIDVRILDADSGDVLDSIAVRKAVKSGGMNVGGTAAFASTVASLLGKSASTITPDVNLQSAHKEGVDKALRACIDASVLELIKRLPAATAANNTSTQ
jgi:curli biogenesis system outer membrane secretion channel CsgG